MIEAVSISISVYTENIPYSALCPVKILHKYLSTRLSKFDKNSSSDSLFLMEDGEALTRLYFISHLKSILQFLGSESGAPHILFHTKYHCDPECIHSKLDYIKSAQSRIMFLAMYL
jgi:hypothetical protein